VIPGAGGGRDDGLPPRWSLSFDVLKIKIESSALSARDLLLGGQRQGESPPSPSFSFSSSFSLSFSLSLSFHRASDLSHPDLT
jgi:hypothetical protein